MGKMSEISMIDKILGNELEGSLAPETSILQQGYDPGHSLYLLYNNILKDQIEADPTDQTIDLPINDVLDLIKQKIKFLKMKEDFSEQEINDIEGVWRSILEEILNKFQEKFDFDFSEKYHSPANVISTKSLEKFIFALYHFLVIQHVENSVTFITKIIFANKKELAKIHKKKLIDRRNLSLASLKATFKFFDDVVIVFFLNDIIKEILEEEIIFKNFINTLEEENEGEISMLILKEIIDEDNEAFVKNYLSFINKDEGIFYSIASRVRMALIESLPQKK